MRRDLVDRRRWVEPQTFLDLVALTSLLPGPSSTELAIALGRRRAGWRGLVVAGACFIVPAALLVGVLAWAYDRHGSSPVVADVRRALLPVVVAVVAHAAILLLRSATRRAFTAAVAIAACGAWLAGVDELVVLGVGAAVGLAGARMGLPMLGVAPLAVFGVFFKIGALLFGSGYVLLAFLEGELVDSRGWVGLQQVVDAVAIGQVTPGPLFTTATFLGFLVAGAPGAVAATVGIFLPSFLLVALLGSRLDALLRSASARPVLDGLGAAAIGLVVAVVVDLGTEAYPHPGLVVVTAGALVVLLRTNIHAGWLLLVAALGGIVLR